MYKYESTTIDLGDSRELNIVRTTEGGSNRLKATITIPLDSSCPHLDLNISELVDGAIERFRDDLHKYYVKLTRSR